MPGIFAQYPYLWTSLVLLAVAAALLAAERRHRRSLWFAGSAGMLFGLFSFEFIPWYWDPAVTMHFIASPEDLLFSFATGTIAWWLALKMTGGKLELELGLAGCIRRGILFALPGVAIAYSLGLTVMNHRPIETTLIGVGVMGLVFAWLKRGFILPICCSALLFGLFYLVLLKLALLAFPDFINAWHPQIQPGYTVFGVPPFELYWALGYGLVFPLYLLLVFRATAAGREGLPGEAFGVPRTEAGE